MTDSNGYNPSLMTTEQGECYICGRHTETARHEIFYGWADREFSKKYGTWINVCPVCHWNIHASAVDYKYLKAAAQRAFEAKHGHDEYMKIFGRNYL